MSKPTLTFTAFISIETTPPYEFEANSLRDALTWLVLLPVDGPHAPTPHKFRDALQSVLSVEWAQ